MIKIITTVSEARALRKEWNTLARYDTRDGFFKTWEWNIGWFEYIGVKKSAKLFIITVRNEQGKLIGLAPFCRYIYQDLGFRLQAIMPMGREIVSGDYLDILTDPISKNEVLNSVLEVLYQYRNIWDIVLLAELLVDSETLSKVLSWRKQNNFLFKLQEQRICPYAQLPNTYEEFWNKLSSKMRNNIKRRTKKIKNAGMLLDVFQGIETIEYLDWLFELHKKRWLKNNFLGNFEKSGFKEFIKWICNNLLPPAQVLLYCLHKDNQPIGCQLVFDWHKVRIFYQCGRDPAYNKWGIGQLLITEAIKDAINRGIKFIDFLRGDEKYKKDWCPLTRISVTACIGHGIKTWFYFKTEKLKNFLKNIICK